MADKQARLPSEPRSSGGGGGWPCPRNTLHSIFFPKPRTQRQPGYFIVYPSPWLVSFHTLLSICHSPNGYLVDVSLFPPLLESEPVRRDQVCLGHCCVPSMGLPQSSILADKLPEPPRKRIQPCPTI